MTRSSARVAFALLGAVLVLGAAPAYAGYPNTIKGAHRDCGAGHYPLQGHYSIKVLESALASLSTSDVEYTTCKDALEAAIRAAEKPKHPRTHTTTTPTTPTTTTTTTTTPTKTTTTTSTSSSHSHHRTHVTKPPRGTTGGTGPVSAQQITAAVTNGKQPQKFDGVLYRPGAIITHDSSFISSIPDPVLAVIAALILVIGGFGGLAVRNIVRARRSA
jgi:cobalamin biosynthesis Mg chelatase CobN